jgi:monoamine oxidase
MSGLEARNPKIAVIGAGLTGLLAAQGLQKV